MAIEELQQQQEVRQVEGLQQSGSGGKNTRVACDVSNISTNVELKGALSLRASRCAASHSGL